MLFLIAMIIVQVWLSYRSSVGKMTVILHLVRSILKILTALMIPATVTIMTTMMTAMVKIHASVSGLWPTPVLTLILAAPAIPHFMHLLTASLSVMDSIALPSEIWPMSGWQMPPRIPNAILERLSLCCATQLFAKISFRIALKTYLMTLGKMVGHLCEVKPPSLEWNQANVSNMLCGTP